LWSAGRDESFKLWLLAQKAGKEGVITDEEYESGMRQLAAESVMQASDADLEAWLAAHAAAQQCKATPSGQT
jgi:hypothetical protein